MRVELSVTSAHRPSVPHRMLLTRTSALLPPAPPIPLITPQLDGIDGSAFTALDVLNELLLADEQQIPEQAQVRVLACPAVLHGHRAARPAGVVASRGLQHAWQLLALSGI